MANLTSDKNLDKHLKVIKSGEEITSLELATEGNGAKITGDLEITGSITNTVGMFELLGDKIVVNAGFLYFIDLQNRLHFSENDVDSFYNMFFVSNSDTTLNVNNATTKGIQTEIRGGTITAADTTNTYDSALNVSVTLNDSSDSGSCIYKLIEGVATNADITGWDELYMMHLAGAGTTWINNAGSIAIPSTQKVFLDGGTDASNGHTYISETSDDVLDVYVGNKRMVRLDESNDKISHAAGNYVAAIANGTEFSATNSAYAGMILGYTCLEGNGTIISTFEIQNSLTVEDSTHQISFKTPPSEKVEIEATFVINVGSTDTRIRIGLSDNSTYNSIGVKFEYDNNGIFFSDDEVDDGVHVVKWVLGASELAAIGSSNTFYIGFSTANLTKTAYLSYGVRASHSVADHPFVIKATALPTTIYDGT